MKVALVHDYIKEYGGAERVLETLHEIWPEAPVFTTVYLPEFLGPHRERFADWEIKTSWLQKIPFIGKLISPVRLLSPWIFENWDFSGFDLIIVSATGAYFPNLIIRKPGTLHLCYCHTPPRYLYGYPTARNWQKYPWGRFLGNFVNHHLRQTDFLSYQRPDYIIANSRETGRRIAKFYRREAKVIYPPASLCEALRAGPLLNIELRTKNQEPKARKYYLTGGRLARAKHVDLAIEACNKLKLPLKVFGKSFADYGEKLKQIAGPTIEFVGEVSDSELAILYRGAKVLIYPSEAEDFGIMPVEAMAAGIPVIAYNDGGVKETVINGKTGILFNKLTADNIIKAIESFNSERSRTAQDKQTIKKDDCIKQAEKFGKERFIQEISHFVNSKLNKSIRY